MGAKSLSSQMLFTVVLSIFVFRVVSDSLMGRCLMGYRCSFTFSLMSFGRQLMQGLVVFAGASFFVIMLHASTYVPQEAVEGFDLEMDGIQTV